jgi:hypothetical protein
MGQPLTGSNPGWTKVIYPTWRASPPRVCTDRSVQQYRRSQPRLVVLYDRGQSRQARGLHGLIWANSRAIRAPKLWEILSEHDKRVGVINVPVTYPAEPVNGYVIPGFLTPPGATGFTYPPELYNEIVKAVGDYVLNVKIAGREEG